MKLFISFLMIFCCLNVQAKSESSYTYTTKQYYLMKLAYEEGQKVGFPRTVQAILWQETHAGKFGPIGNDGPTIGERSYCHMQIKLGTVKDVLKYMGKPIPRYDEELLVKLLTNDRFCVMLGANYFKMLYSKSNNWSKAVLAYNRGPGGKGDPNDYVFKVNMLVKTRIKDFNKRY